MQARPVTWLRCVETASDIVRASRARQLILYFVSPDCRRLGWPAHPEAQPIRRQRCRHRGQERRDANDDESSPGAVALPEDAARQLECRIANYEGPFDPADLQLT